MSVAQGGIEVTGPNDAESLCPLTICSESKTPLLLTGALIWTLRNHFASPENIRETSFQNYVWNVDDKLSKIMIESVTRWKPGFVEQRPAVLVKRNSWKPMNNITLANRQDRAIIVGDGIGRKIDTGEHYEVLILGSHTLFCIGGTGGEAETLGAEVFLQELEFATKIRDDFNMVRFNVEEVGPPQKLEESDEHWVVPVNVVYAIGHNWMLQPIGPLLKSMSIITL